MRLMVCGAAADYICVRRATRRNLSLTYGSTTNTSASGTDTNTFTDTGTINDVRLTGFPLMVCGAAADYICFGVWVR